MLLKNIANLLDFDPELEYHILKTEFNHKFSETYMRINGKPMKILYWDGDYIVTDKGNFDVHQEHSITPIVLEAGLYFTNEFICYVYRIPKRQWKKSFAINENTGVKFLQNTPKTYEQVIEAEYQPLTIIWKDMVYLLTKMIGTHKNGCITLKDDTFFHEMKELWTQYEITTELKNQPKLQAENLINQFFVELKLN